MLKKVCVISDNQYFSAGLRFLLEGGNYVTVKLPHEIKNSAELLPMDIVYVYIRNRKLHRQVCRYLRGLSSRPIFFLRQAIHQQGLEFHFWDARMSPDSFCQQISTASSHKNRRYLARQTPCNRRRIARASEGIEYFNQELKAKKVSIKAMHNHHRQLLKVFGIESVSIHNLYLSEYMAAGLNAACFGTEHVGFIAIEDHGYS